MIIDLSCPVEMRGYELLHDDLGRARAYIDLSNVSDHTLSAYRATARWSKDGTDQAQNDYVSVDSLEIPPGDNFRLMLSACSSATYSISPRWSSSRVSPSTWSFI